MSLQVWLPLNGDLHNQGLSNVTVTGGIVDNNGKIGKCYLVSKTAPITITQNLQSTSEWSITYWAKLPSSMNNATAWETMFSFTTINSDAGTNSVSAINWANYHQVKIWDDTNHQWLWAAPGREFNYDVWHHWAIVHTANGNGVQCKIYIDGHLIGSYANTTHQMKIRSGNIVIGGGISTGGFYLDDFRIYDHALSPLEVKRLAQGLVLHYPLNRGGLGPSNLLKNGFGEFGSENWSNSNIYTDVPSGHSEIKKSYRDNESLEFIPLLRNCTYKFSYWVKAAYSSGYSYPSLKPYDADKLFINTNNCREGFSLSTMTALKKQLNPGDTKIYVDDLSAWNANSGHYYDTVAIFSYTDGQGYTWPDGTYTRNCPAFSSGTEAKTNLDKTNNIITLLSAYTGPTMPIGTKVCASTYGSTFFYPSGGINNSTIADWTYKEGVFSSQHSRLECAKYIRVYAYSSCYQAGMILSNLTLEDMDNNIEYDCSGYGNNGTRVGTFSWSGDTPRYSVSTVFDGSNYISRTSLTADILTFSCWVKTSKNKSTSQIIVADSTSQLCISFYAGTIITFYGSSGHGTGSKCILGNEYKENDWNHIVVVKTGTDTRKVYCNGIEQVATSNDYWASQSTGFTVGRRETSTPHIFYGQLSDLRVYATALSADDVMALYKNAGYVDSDGNVYAYEMTE